MPVVKLAGVIANVTLGGLHSMIIGVRILKRSDDKNGLWGYDILCQIFKYRD